MADVTPKILVVDEDAQNRLVYGEWLRDVDGVEVVEAATALQALQLAREHDFAMFLVDLSLTGMDGFELASQLRQHPRSEATPILFVGSEASERDYRARGYRLGAVDFMISPPASGETLAHKARVFIQFFRRRKELQELVDRAQRENRELQERLQRFVEEHAALRALATRDALTRLPNRALFHDRLAAALARSDRSRRRVVLAYAGLDGVKTASDRHGPATGDALMRAAAERLARSLRATDTVARVGNDQFALLFEGVESAADAEYVAQKIDRMLAASVTLRSEADQADVEVSFGASIGVAVYPDQASEIDDLMVLADLTMDAVRRIGGGARVFPGKVGKTPPSGARPAAPPEPSRPGDDDHNDHDDR